MTVNMSHGTKEMKICTSPAEGSGFFAVRENFSSGNEVSVQIIYSHM